MGRRRDSGLGGTRLCAWSELFVSVWVVCTCACLFFLLLWGQLNLGNFSTRNSQPSPTGCHLKPIKVIQPRENHSHQLHWCGVKVAQVGSGRRNKEIPEFTVSPSRRGWQGSEGSDMHTGSPPCPALPFPRFLDERSSSGCPFHLDSGVWSTQAGRVFVVGPHGA